MRISEKTYYLPRFSLRDLFWLVLVAALGCAWWMDRSRLVAGYWKMVDSMSDSEMFQIDRTMNLEDAVRAKVSRLSGVKTVYFRP